MVWTHRRSGGVGLLGFTDLDWEFSMMDRKITSGCCLSLGSTSLTWFSRKKNSISLSCTKAEYIESSHAKWEGLWIHKLLVDLFDRELSPTKIYFNNKSCIHLSKNPVFHDRSKHINIIYHFI